MTFSLDTVVLVVAGRPVLLGETLLAAAGFAFLLIVAMTITQLRSARRQAEEAAAAAERAREIDDKVAEMNRLQAELTGRMQTMAEIFGTRQSDMARLVTERLDGLRQHLGQNLEANVKQTGETLGKLNERLAVIDAAQKNITDLTGEMLSLKDVLANKQSRGAYGQGRMEAIVRDGLPQGLYLFQPTLSNGKRPDCVVTLPGDPRGLVIDAKFPLESFAALRAATSDPERKQVMQKLRQDVGVHVKDIAEKYLLSGETQDIALMFVPSESIYADLHEQFDDIIQRANRARVLIVSPALLALAIQVMQSLVRDARMREESLVIQAEVGKLLEDVRRLGERVDKLDTHFRQAQDDVAAIRTSQEKIVKRGDRIGALEFDDPVPANSKPVTQPLLRGLDAAE